MPRRFAIEGGEEYIPLANKILDREIAMAKARGVNVGAKSTKINGADISVSFNGSHEYVQISESVKYRINEFVVSDRFQSTVPTQCYSATVSTIGVGISFEEYGYPELHGVAASINGTHYANSVYGIGTSLSPDGTASGCGPYRAIYGGSGIKLLSWDSRGEREQYGRGDFSQSSRGHFIGSWSLVSSSGSAEDFIQTKEPELDESVIFSGLENEEFAEYVKDALGTVRFEASLSRIWLVVFAKSGSPVISYLNNEIENDGAPEVVSVERYRYNKDDGTFSLVYQKPYENILNDLSDEEVREFTESDDYRNWIISFAIVHGGKDGADPDSEDLTETQSFFLKLIGAK